MKPIHVKSSSYAEYGVDSNEEDAKFQVDDHVRISKYKNIFAIGYVPNCSEEVFIISKIKNAVRWTYVINDLLKLLEIFMKKNCKRLIKKNLE